RFDEIVVLRDQDRFDIVRPVYKARRHAQEAEENDVSKYPRAPREIADRIAARFEHAAEQRNTLWTGRKLHLRRSSLSLSTLPRTAPLPRPRAPFPPRAGAWLPGRPRSTNFPPSSRQTRTAGSGPADRAERISRRPECGS